MAKTFKCDLCSEKFESRSTLKVHILSEHDGSINKSSEHDGLDCTQNKNFNCNVCSYVACANHRLIVHMRKHTGERPFKCTVEGCGMDFAVHQYLKNHLNCKHSDDRRFQCNFPGCRFTTKTSGSLVGHQKVHSAERPFACPNIGCNFRCKRNSLLRRHLKSVHSDVKKFACSKCDYKTDRNDVLRVHITSRHSESTTKDFKCSYPSCTAAFSSSVRLGLHFSNRHGERHIKCDQPGCLQKFATTHGLYNHKWGVHSKKIHACPELDCSYRAKYLSKIASHMIVHDETNETFPCSIEGCLYKGKNSRCLENHMRRHKTLVACLVSGCGQYLSTQKALRDHVKLHNPSGRPFQCPLCFKYYPTRWQLKAHSVSHTNEKTFTCGHCEFGAARRETVRNHISSVHSNVKFPFVVLPLNDRECLPCKVTLPPKEFVVHSIGHAVPVVLLHRIKTKWS